MTDTIGSPLSYLLVTPAHNEEAFLRGTLESVVGQTHKPVRYLVVSDGSTDGTDDIVREFASQYDWIELYRRPERETRDFGGKAHCFNSGYDRIKDLPHDAVVSLDADLTFDADYFSFLLGKMAQDAELGVVGTPFSEEGITYDYRFTNIEHVSGACQVFRRECLIQLGGYEAIKGGGIDWVAVTSARMHGWKTRTFTEKVCHHHRAMGSAGSTSSRALFRLGMQDQYLGGSMLWQCVRSIYQASRRPYILGGLLLMTGYVYSGLKKTESRVSPQLKRFHRKEQHKRIKSKLGALVFRGAKSR